MGDDRRWLRLGTRGTIPSHAPFGPVEGIALRFCWKDTSCGRAQWDPCAGPNARSYAYGRSLAREGPPASGRGNRFGRSLFVRYIAIVLLCSKNGAADA